MMFMKKTRFLKNMKARRPLYSCSRIRVGEGSPYAEGTDKLRSTLYKTLQIWPKKTMQNIRRNKWTNQPQIEPISMKNRPKNQSYREIGDRKPENGDRKLENGDRNLENWNWMRQTGYWSWKMELGTRKMVSSCQYPVGAPPVSGVSRADFPVTPSDPALKYINR